jgi:hypothetical protein
MFACYAMMLTLLLLCLVMQGLVRSAAKLIIMSMHNRKLICCCCLLLQGLEIDARSAAKLKATADELSEERELALTCIKEAAAAAAQ